MQRHRHQIISAAACLLLAVLAQSLLAQQANQPANANRPIPRLPNGEISFAPPGEKGVWDRGDYRPIVPENEDQTALRDRGRAAQGDPSELKPTFSEVPFQPWSKELYLWRQVHEIEPYGRCKPAGGFRDMAIPYGTDIVQDVEQKRIYIFHTGGSHNVRTIYMDGREHPRDLEPSYGGHSVGRWEGDVLVIDTVGFNERGWIDAYGTPTTKQLHLTERIKRLSFNQLSYELTIDDPGAYTQPWSTGMLMNWRPNRETFQVLCQDGNLAGQLMVGEGSSGIDRASPIVP
jgi:hypothetical protein